MDVDTQTVLFEKAADDPVPPASLAKLMTAELVFRDLKKGSITLDTPFYISERAWKAAQSGTSMFARVNTNIRVEDLLRGLIVQSGNDAAIALAEGHRRVGREFRGDDECPRRRTGHEQVAFHRFVGRRRSGPGGFGARHGDSWRNT